MKKKIYKLSFLLFAFGLSSLSYSQGTDESINWYNGKGPGMETELAYKMLKKKKPTDVVVAVIDSGVDIEHEDLDGQIWVNSDEVAGNGIDDDKNGYIDDIHGWNFLGNSNGENIDATRLEKTRIYAKLKPKYEGVDAENAENKEEYELYLKVKEEVDETYKSMKAEYKEYKQIIDANPEYKKYYNDQLQFNLNPDYDDRSLIGDNPDDINDTKYGNNDYEGPDALHGTHVSGIIAAVRGNGIGGDGVAKNAKIMSLRAVPNGDEHDKDVALAIRYAVDNGAQVINMSFGKSYSPNAEWVYDALKYADTKGVLVIHAAGNDNANVDETPNFPTSKYDFQKEQLGHYLTIGASTYDSKGNLAAEFSNYGKTTVDVFAPGYEIWNTVPNNEYQNLQGTSMAAPMVAGVAAMLKGYFPNLSMLDIKNAIMSSAASYKGTKQTLPGTTDLVDFGTMSISGGVVNVKNAIVTCKKLEKSK
jgi:cell wall-associated protease